MIKTFFYSLLFFAMSLGMAHAASVGFGIPQQAASGSSYMTPLIMATGGTPINAVEGSLTVPAGVTDVYDASSIVAFWTTPPSIKNGKVTFSGIIPGGFEGTGVIAWLVHGSDTTPEGARIDSFTALQNDGMGTSDAVTLESNGVLTVDTKTVTTAEDQTPPEPFPVVIVGIPDEDGAMHYAASFATRDNETGIDRYEVQETRARKPAEDGWRIAESPYVLIDQDRKSTVFVRAIDNAGNVRESSSGSADGMLRTFLLVIAALALIIGVWRFRRNIRTR